MKQGQSHLPVWRHRSQDCLLIACFQRHVGAIYEPAKYMRMQQVPRHANKGNIQACSGNVPNVIRLNALSAQARGAIATYTPTTNHFRRIRAKMLGCSWQEPVPRLL